MLGRRHFLQLMGGGLTSLLGGVGGLDEGLEGLAAVDRRPSWRLGPERHGEVGGLDGLDGVDGPDGYGAVDGPPAISTAEVIVPMVFPVLAGATYTDTFLACRDGCQRQHLGQDLFAEKLRPVVATFDAVVTYLRSGRPTAGNVLSIRSPDGWTANYLHLNNDSPGSDDGAGTPLQAFAPGVHEGASVRAGQLLGWVGDSGNAELTSPHLHFELRRGEAWAGTVHNPLASLDLAERWLVAAAVGPLPDGIVVRANGVKGLWLVDRGWRRPLPPGVHTANGLSVQPVVRVPAGRLRAHPQGAPVPLRDGLVVRGPDRRCWAVAGGCRQPLDLDGLHALGLDYRAIRQVDADALATVPADGGEELGHVRAGALLRARGTPEVWLVTEDDARRHVPDQMTFGTWGWRHAEVAEVPAGPLDTLPVRAPLPLRDGTLARTADGALHLVSGGRRRRFTGDAAAAAAGWPVARARPLTEEALARLPLGFPMP